MEVSHLLRRCLWCGRPYKRPSRPVWAFDKELNLAGTVHTSHAAAWRQGTEVSYWNAAFDGDPEFARRRAWVDARHSDLPLGPLVLFVDPGDRERHLAFWRSTGHVTEAQAGPLLEEVDALDAEYAARFPELLKLGD